MITGPTGFYVVAHTLITEAHNEMVNIGYALLTRVGVVPGDIALDDCECGQLAASVFRWFYTDDFPSEQDTAQFSPCNASFIVGEIRINLARCAPQPEGDSLAPDMDVLRDAAITLISEAHTLRNSVMCKLADMERNNDIVSYMMREHATVGPAGACVGSELTVLVALENR